MDFSNYTDRARGFIQSAQTQALARGHQKLTPEHVAKVLLEDNEGLASNLIRAAGGQPELALQKVNASLDLLPRVEGSGAGSLYPTPELARFFELSQQVAKKAGDKFVTAERLLLALAMSEGTQAVMRSKVLAPRPSSSMKLSTRSARAAPPTAKMPSSNMTLSRNMHAT